MIENSIIHYCQDEKFINSSYHQFNELFPQKNHFYIYDCENQKTKHINVNQDFSFIDTIPESFKKIPENSLVIFHSLPEYLISYLHLLPKSATTVWLQFGYEIYGDHNLYSQNILLDRLTKKHFKKEYPKDKIKDKIKTKIFPFLRLFKKELYLTHGEQASVKKKKKIEQLKRINFWGTSYREECQHLSKTLGYQRPLFEFYYYSLEQILNIESKIILNKNKIMIGHSGFPNGNHLDILEKIKEFKTPPKDIIVPFSYGIEDYKKYIKKYNPIKNVSYIEDFLPLKEYNKILNEVKIAVFNNRRQQALGNIISLLYFGAKVFMSNKNTFYHFLKRKGIHVYCYETELNTSNFHGLSIDQIKTNRKILKNFLGEDILKEKLRKSILQTLNK